MNAVLMFAGPLTQGSDPRLAAADTSPVLGWPLAAGVAALLAITVVASWRGRVGIERASVTAALRAVVQLAAITTVIAYALEHRWAALVLAGVMFAVGVFTAVRRLNVGPCWVWVALAMFPAAAGVLVIVFASGAAPFTAPSIVAIAGILVGNTMVGAGLAGRVLFDALEEGIGQVEAGVSLGFSRSDAVLEVIGRRGEVALIPTIDSIRTIGLVKLPGAFIGVILGGGSATQAAASQVLVLVGILATQTVVTALLMRLIAHLKVIPTALAARIPPG